MAQFHHSESLHDKKGKERSNYYLVIFNRDNTEFIHKEADATIVSTRVIISGYMSSPWVSQSCKYLKPNVMVSVALSNPDVFIISVY